MAARGNVPLVANADTITNVSPNAGANHHSPKTLTSQLIQDNLQQFDSKRIKKIVIAQTIKNSDNLSHCMPKSYQHQASNIVDNQHIIEILMRWPCRLKGKKQ